MAPNRLKIRVVRNKTNEHGKLTIVREAIDMSNFLMLEIDFDDFIWQIRGDSDNNVLHISTAEIARIGILPTSGNGFDLKPMDR